MVRAAKLGLAAVVTPAVMRRMGSVTNPADESIRWWARPDTRQFRHT
jgi:hypothetical protein